MPARGDSGNGISPDKEQAAGTLHDNGIFYRSAFIVHRIFVPDRPID